MIKRMKKDSFLLLVVGILLGFAVTYGLVRDRDLGPIVVRESATTRAALEAKLEEELGRVQELEARLEQDPGNFQILVALANLYFDMQSLDGAIDYYSVRWRSVRTTPTSGRTWELRCTTRTSPTLHSANSKGLLTFSPIIPRPCSTLELFFSKNAAKSKARSRYGSGSSIGIPVIR